MVKLLGSRIWACPLDELDPYADAHRQQRFALLRAGASWSAPTPGLEGISTAPQTPKALCVKKPSEHVSVELFSWHPHPWQPSYTHLCLARCVNTRGWSKQQWTSHRIQTLLFPLSKRHHSPSSVFMLTSLLWNMHRGIKQYWDTVWRIETYMGTQVFLPFLSTGIFLTSCGPLGI